jgi:hypothetical protein
MLCASLDGMTRPQCGILEPETIRYIHESRGTRTREWLRWRGPAAIVRERPILLSERILYNDYDRKGSTEQKIASRETQGVWRQDEMIGGKLPVVK